jgi:ribose-phosphate pyrophosphokinase
VKLLDLTHADLPGDLPFEQFFFPDGQPHLRLEGGIGELDHVQILTRIKSGDDIALLGLAVDAVRSVCKGRISVNISYLLGARMDRPIGPGQPFTLRVLAGMLNAACEQANDVRILDPHSPVTLEMVKHALDAEPGCVVVVPDQGARSRIDALMRAVGPRRNAIVICGKKRDPNTGALSGFELLSGLAEGLRGDRCLIIDDLCDGGGTFAGLSNVLRDAGAVSVSLCVTHGIFSKDLPIFGIGHVYCTDSYAARESAPGLTVLSGYMREWVTSPKK